MSNWKLFFQVLYLSCVHNPVKKTAAVFNEPDTDLITYLFILIFSQTVTFPQKFYEHPTVITTPKHRIKDVNAQIEADNNAITEWIEVGNMKGDLNLAWSHKSIFSQPLKGYILMQR